MKVESLVIIREYSIVNFKSNFAHTAHHARKIGRKGRIYYLLIVLLTITKILELEIFIGNLSEVDTRYW